MKKRITEPLTESRLFSINDLQQYLSLGRTRAQEIGNAAGAAVSVGRRKLYDRRKIDAYIDTLH